MSRNINHIQLSIGKNEQITEFNKAAEIEFGYTEEEILGENFDTLLNQTDANLIFNQCLRKGGYVGEINFNRKNGDSFSVLISAAIRINPSGEKIGIDLLLKESTTHRQIKERLQASEDKYRSLFENSPLGILVFLDQKIILSNPRAHRIMGYSSNFTITGKTIDEFIFHLDQDLFYQQTKPLYGKIGTSTNIPELRLLGKRGFEIPVAAVAQSIYYQQSKAIQLIFIDLTVQILAQESIRLLHQAISQVEESIIITDFSGKIQFANPAFEKITGYKIEESLEKNISFVIRDNQLQKLLQDIKTGKNENQMNIFQTQTTNNRGETHREEISLSIVSDLNGKLTNFVFISRDITRQAMMEEQIRQSQKLEAVGHLAGGIAHDFNNIMTGIIGYSELTLMKFESNDPKVKHLDSIIKKASEASNLINQLLAFSRKQILELNYIDLNKIIKESHKFLGRVILDSIDFSFDLVSKEIIIYADFLSIQQILTNLAVNAQDAMPGGGTINISTKIISIHETEVKQFHDLEPGEFALFTFTDDGKGMSEETINTIFDPFFTTKDIGQGPGLGLSTVYGLVKQQNGYLTCESELGKGTTFKIYFPIVYESKKEEKIQKQPRVCKETILLVEDDFDLINVINKILTNAGYKIYNANNGMVGLDKLIKYQDEINMIISDVYTPKMSGLDFFLEMKNQNMSKPFLFITGNSEVTSHSEILQDIEILQKPFSSVELIQRINKILNISEKETPESGFQSK